MDKPPQHREPPGQLGPPAESCQYCGAPLNPAYYFCLACATPYKHIDSVLPRLRSAPLTDAELIAKKAPHVAPLFWTYVAVVVGSTIVRHLLFQEERPGLGLLIQSFAIFVTTCIFGSIHWRCLAVQLRRAGLFHPAAWLGLLALAPLLLGNYFYHSWILRLTDVDFRRLGELREYGLSEPTLIFCLCVLPAIVEETAFRGLIQHWLQVALSPFRALVLASALFTMLHFTVISAPYLFLVGMVLGWTKWKTQSLYPSMLIHFIHNLVVLEFFAL